MRIAYVASPKIFSRGASSIEVMRMAEAIAKLGHDVELIVPYNGKEDRIYECYGVSRVFKGNAGNTVLICLLNWYAYYPPR